MTNALFMLKIVAAVVSQSSLPECPKEVSWERILRLSAMHNITNIIAYGIIKGKYNVPEEIMGQFKKSLFLQLTVSENQRVEIKRIYDVFSKNGIDYMPFKGLFICDLYPSLDMRFMSDGDILIKKEQKDKLNNLMLDMGYTFKAEGPIEYEYIKKPYMHIELHHTIMSPTSEDFYEYYKDSWSFAQSTDDKNRYELSLEDHFIFVYIHFVRHYRDAGAGVKAIIDMWLYMNRYPDMDWDYIKGELEKLNTKVFFDNLCRLIEFWFEDGKSDEVVTNMTEFILSSGTFGTKVNSLSAKSIRASNGKLENAKQKQFFRMFFPNFQYMQRAFPILNKYPFLMPFLWLWRLIRGAIFKDKRKNIKSHTNAVKYTDNEKVKAYEQHMTSVGLDIYNGRRK